MTQILICGLQHLSIWRILKLRHLVYSYPFHKWKILDSSKLKEFADNNFLIWWKWQKVHKKVRKHWGKRRNCSLWAISPFPTVFSKDIYGRHVKKGLVWERKKKGLFGKGLIDLHSTLDQTRHHPVMHS